MKTSAEPSTTTPSMLVLSITRKAAIARRTTLLLGIKVEIPFRPRSRFRDEHHILLLFSVFAWLGVLGA